MYQPKFCADCGERITRDRWHLWTSRRFCSQCAPRFRAALLWWATLASAVLFSLGLIAGRATQPATPPLIIERREPPVDSTQIALGQSTPPNTRPANAPAGAALEQSAGNATAERTVDSVETVSICGALTKKGAPCQRRVRGTGRCYQHKGQPAIIPLEQRVVTGK